MESNNLGDSLQKMLITELIQGRDVAKQLQLIFSKDQRLASATSNEAQDLLMQKILACFDKSITILQSDSINQQSQQIVVGTVDSPNSFSASPKSQDSDGDFKDLDQKEEHKKSRKLFPLERIKLPGCSSSGLEQPVEDGYNWRKYGQKDILGTKYPRAYYRCTLRRMQECLATKQVQRCDDDPTIFEVTYRGKHTCAQAASSSSNPYPHPNPNPSLADIKLEPIETLPYPHHQPSHEIIWSFQQDQQKDIKPLNANNNYHHNSPSFSFPSSSNPRVTTHQAPTTVLYNTNGNFTYNHSNFAPSPYSCSTSPMMTTFDPASTSLANGNPPRATTPEFSLDQGEFDPDFMFDNSQFFP